MRCVRYLYNRRSSLFPPKHWHTMMHRNQTHHQYCGMTLIWTLQHSSVCLTSPSTRFLWQKQILCIIFLIFIESVDSKAKERSSCLSRSRQRNIWQPRRKLSLIDFQGKPARLLFWGSCDRVKRSVSSSSSGWRLFLESRVDVSSPPGAGAPCRLQADLL